MNYCCLYTFKKKEKDEKFTQHICFREVYTVIKSYEYLKIHVLKDYSKFHSFKTSNSLKFSEEDIVNYHKLMIEAGFFVDLILKDNVTVTEGTTSQSVECYTFKIDCQKNNMLTILLLINIIRFLYERDFPSIVQTILKYKDEKCSFYNKIVIACYTCNDYYNVSGHSFIPYYNKLLVLLEDSDFIKYGDKKSYITNLRDNLLQGNSITIEKKTELIEKIQNSSFEEVFEFYKKLLKK